MRRDEAPLPDPVEARARGVFCRVPRRFGTSVLGAPLEVFETERSAGPPALVLAGTHGDEGEGVALLSAALRSVPPGALATDVVLALNPDGLARGTRGNARGVDLNRNWPTSDWAATSTAYRWTLDQPREVRLSTGEAAASEPETKALLELLAARPPALVVSIHAPLGLIDDPASTPLGRWLAARTGLPHVPDVGYPTPGSFGTWGGERGLPIVTVELPDAPREHIVRDHVAALFAVLVGRLDVGS